MRGSDAAWLIGLLLFAGAWRGVIAWLLPVISKDGCTFCWFARDLAAAGAAYLRLPGSAQHPLYPLALLAVERLVRSLGMAESPVLWLRAGQLVAWTCGMVVALQSWVLTRRFAADFFGTTTAPRVALFGAALAAFLPLNVWLSADAMSDELHLAMYLGAVLLSLRLDSAPRALACGVLSGLAFLTRPEGMVTLFAALAALLAQRLGAGSDLGPRRGWAGFALRGMTLIGGFVIVALPYWLIVGELSPKKNPLEWLHAGEAAATAGSGGLLADSIGLDLAFWQLPLEALHQLLRAGRIIVPLLALTTLALGRTAQPPAGARSGQQTGVKLLFVAKWIAPLVCIVLHFALTLVLLRVKHYLDQRHMLVIVMLLIPAAACAPMLIAGAISRRRANASEQAAPNPLAKVVVAACLLPLMIYSLRLPNAADLPVVEALRCMESLDGSVRGKSLLAGSSPRRIAFYGDMRWQYWPEQRGAIKSLRKQILGGQPDYFAVETGEEFAARGNDAALAALLADTSVGPRMREICERPYRRRAGDRAMVRIYRLDWSRR